MHAIAEDPGFHLPWIDPALAVNESEEEAAEYLDVMRSPLGVTSWRVDEWWMEQGVPGYNVLWQDVDAHMWKVLYRRHPELFLTSSVPIQRFMGWRQSSIHSGALRQAMKDM
jgi:hypothetical protein